MHDETDKAIMAKDKRGGGRRRCRLATMGALVGTATLVMGACGSSSVHTSSGASTAGGSGGTRAASGSRITIGVVEWNEGAGNQGAGMGPGLKGGLDYVNKVLGGVHGHSIATVVCDSDTSTSLEVNCANKFVSSHVAAVFDDGDAGFASEKPILDRAGIPIFGVQALDPPDDDSSTAYFFGPPEEAYAAGPLEIFHNMGMKKLSLTILNTPAYVEYVQEEIVPVAKKLGMTVNVSYYDGTSTNWAVEAATLTASHPQLTGIIAGPEGNCTSLLEALRSGGFSGPVLMGSCSAYVSADPQGAVNTYSYSGGWLPELAPAAPAVTKTQIAAYDSAMSATGNSDTAALGQWAVNSFAGVTDLAEVLKTDSAPYTTTSITKDLGAVTNFQSFMGPVDTCNHQEWPGTSSCNHDLLLMKVGAGDKYAATNPAGFVPIDPSILSH